MTTPLPLLRDFSDRLSPMVVKEMRQGLRTRFFTAALILFHVLLGLLMCGPAMAQLSSPVPGAAAACSRATPSPTAVTW